MEFFTKSKAIRLRSHLDKYLLAEDDQKTVRQSRNESSRNTIWTIELVEQETNHNHSIRLKSSCGHYLTASQEPLLLGMTGKKVVQTPPPTTRLMYEASAGLIEWEPIRDGFQVKLRTRSGSYLRGNGATKPWRNTVTHDNPHTGSTNNWVLWDVVVVDSSELERSFEEFETRLSRFSSSVSEDSVGSPTSHWSMESAESPVTQRGMEFFQNAKVVRLKGHLHKYLVAEDDQESVIQDRDGTSKFARWTVELIPSESSSLRFKSCFGKYLTASHYPFLIGVTGRKVIQSLPKTLDSSLEWEPIPDGANGSLVKFKTRHGKFLRAHGGPPPWKNHVTHDIPYRSSTQDEVLWNVEILEIHAFTNNFLPKFDGGSLLPTTQTQLACAWQPKPRRSQSEKHLKKLESSGSMVSSTPRAGDRLIFYKVADGNGNVDEASKEISFVFRGAGVADLIRKLEEVTGLDGIVVCTPSPLNGKLYPLRLQLPPNNTTMHVVVIPSS